VLVIPADGWTIPWVAPLIAVVVVVAVVVAVLTFLMLLSRWVHAAQQLIRCVP
jgi:hypothetical protein